MFTFEIIIPINKNTDKHVYNWIDKIACVNGGASWYRGAGVWFDPDGVRHAEPHERVQAICPDKMYIETRDAILAVASEMKRAGEQSVLYFIDGVPHFNG